MPTTLGINFARAAVGGGAAWVVVVVAIVVEGTGAEVDGTVATRDVDGLDVESSPAHATPKIPMSNMVEAMNNRRVTIPPFATPA